MLHDFRAFGAEISLLTKRRTYHHTPFLPQAHRRGSQAKGGAIASLCTQGVDTAGVSAVFLISTGLEMEAGERFGWWIRKPSRQGCTAVNVL